MSNYMMNSIVIAGGSTLLAMVCGIPAAYALSRMKFKGQTAFLGFVIVSQMFAPVVLLIGIYKVMMAFHLTNSIIGLIFINAAFKQAEGSLKGHVSGLLLHLVSLQRLFSYLSTPGTNIQWH